MMKVRDFMVRDVITVRPENTVKDVMSVFVEKKIGGVPITDKDGTLCGIVTDGDIIRAIKPLDRRIHDYFSFITYIAVEDKQVHLSEIINREIIKFAKTNGIMSVQPEDDMEKVVDILSKHHFKKLPVVNGAKRVVGVISRGDVIRNIQQRIVEGL
ncbi:CBS domain-containing protein [Neobacillus drentensis]|uniref:CBS domain-containing protein n=1 Tax=Neobacillus drentensis TaxID=220684 RepID=UPI001F2388EB|nr:CBS domain-containing protein [Neobacillus drentensis]ULT59183.1 CBS domain-containing protein [Neobacillus drentensis]